MATTYHIPVFDCIMHFLQIKWHGAFANQWTASFLNNLIITLLQNQVQKSYNSSIFIIHT
jgi:hypothetical protein